MARNWTREIKAQMNRGLVPVRSIGSPEPVTYAPRRRNDPLPWTDGTFRYNGREVHTVELCGQKMLNLLSGFKSCSKPRGHERAHA